MSGDERKKKLNKPELRGHSSSEDESEIPPVRVQPARLAKKVSSVSGDSGVVSEGDAPAKQTKAQLKKPKDSKPDAKPLTHPKMEQGECSQTLPVDAPVKKKSPFKNLLGAVGNFMDTTTKKVVHKLSPGKKGKHLVESDSEHESPPGSPKKPKKEKRRTKYDVILDSVVSDSSKSSQSESKSTSVSTVSVSEKDVESKVKLDKDDTKPDKKDDSNDPAELA